MGETSSPLHLFTLPCGMGAGCGRTNMRVYLSENAFMDILLSSAEVYKRECLGYLLGYRLEDRFIIEHAFSFQTANRRHKGVVFHDKNHKKIEPIIERFEKLQIIGDFHSHTQFGLSKG
ncbi:MAG: hypothetical protein ACK415_12810, partial [Thermodesulfovibrionales bacterium]